MVELARLVGAQGRVVGLDLSFNMCRLARRRLERPATPGVGGVVQGDAARMPFSDGCFDAGFMSFTLELFDTPRIPKVLGEYRRVLRPGGRLGVVALSKESPATPMRRAYEWGHDRFPRLLDCRPIFVRRALTETGFGVVEELPISLWGLPVAVVVARSPTG